MIRAAAGGMIVPAAIYLLVNRGDAESMRGWAIPSATDIAFALGVAAAPLASLAAGADTFANGQSYYGQPTSPQAATRAVDLGSASAINVAYGESVTFRSGAQLFTWTFNGFDRRAVDVTNIAPAGFPTKPLVVYVGLNPANRR